MKLAHIWPDLDNKIGGLFEVGLFGRIGVETEIAERSGKNIVGGIQHVDAAFLEFCQALRLEDDVPAVDFGIESENFLHGLLIVADAGGAPHIIGAKTIVAIVDRKALGYL